MKKILMAVPNYYTSPFQVGSHHYARAFEKLGYEVLFISNPISPIHKIFANDDQLKDREGIYNSNGGRIGNITYYVPKTLFTPKNKPFLSSMFVLKHWDKFSYPNLLNYIKKKGFGSIDIIWFDSPMFSFLLDSLEYKQSILRLADYSKGFSAVSNNQYLIEIEIANKVNKIIYTAKNLKNKYIEIKDKSKMHYISNGIDLDFFEKADKSFPKELENISEPIVVYIGAIHEWFDVHLVYESAKKLHNYNFVIIGPVQQDLSILESLNNIYILGKMPYHRIAQFLSNANVGIIPFDTKNYLKLIESINPLKLYEYFACGLPVVSMTWQALEELQTPALLCHSNDEFIDKIENAYRSHDTSNLKKFVQNSTWTQRLQEILDDEPI